MHRKLTRHQIERLCRELLDAHPRVTVRAVMAELRRRYQAAGRTERVSRILREVESAWRLERRPQEGRADLGMLREQLRAAETRAARSEAIEREHQDFWARRFDERAAELERRYAAALEARAPITADRYLHLRQRIADLTRRLARYEPIDASHSASSLERRSDAHPRAPPETTPEPSVARRE